MIRRFSLLLVVALLAGCQTATPEPEVRRAEAAPTPFRAAPSDACWATDRVPAVTETQFVAVDANGAREPREMIIHPAEDRLFAVPCPSQMTPDFHATLQRALMARGLYSGAVTDIYDAETAEAVRLFQAPLGLNSAILSLDAAQQLGLVAVQRDLL
ncbi:peptidoglycan-binding domain-containing protein [Pararhodobacter sp.]|uniref:peptidoglycan-binding domain-containing protein n=1 Tax=Pararhodobacter sp. TaxID=2127056 RepID=UPI002AFE8F99|nr:peptidoglycan-binding domain-containing protein [Pararhodobacter sp.]